LFDLFTLSIIEFSDEAAAKRAIAELHETVMHGRPIYLREVFTQFLFCSDLIITSFPA
jgi:hypothetical protein